MPNPIDSYFGIIGNSFYAGPNGASFSIKYTWPNKVELDADLTRQDGLAASPVQVGDYVIISYGDKNDPDYLVNKEIDANAYDGAYYNATLWQKTYENGEVLYQNLVTFSSAEPIISLSTSENVTADTIPHVELDDDQSTSFDQHYIAYLPTSWDMQVGEGSTPNPIVSPSVTIDQRQYSSSEESHTTKYVHFSIPKPWNIAQGNGAILAPGQNPNVIVNYDSNSTASRQPTVNDDTKYIHFQLPEAWDIGLGPSAQVPINPGLSPSVSISYNSTTAGIAATEDSDTKYFYFKLPKAWQFAIGSMQQWTDPGINAQVRMSYDANSSARQESNENDTTKYLHFSLPNAWNVQLGKVTYLTPNADPVVEINTTDANNQVSTSSKFIHFSLPVSQQFQAVTIDPLGPLEQPSANLVFAADDTMKKYPTILLHLPAAIKTLYGDALTRTTDYTIRRTVDIADYNAVRDLSIGDYYINTTLAAVHRVDAIDNNGNVSMKYQGSMQLAIPTISGNAVSPYDQNGNPTVPTITTTVVSTPTSSWNVTVDTIKAPIFLKSSDSGFVASTATGEIKSTARGDNVEFTFKVPRGTRLTTFKTAADKNADSFKSLCLDGDVYLDSIGGLSLFSGNGTSGTWTDAGSLKGSSFVVKNASAIEITDSDLLQYSGTFYEKVGAYIDENYSSMMSTYKLNEVININYQVDVDVWASHWLFKSSNGTWTGSQLTGDASNSIITTEWEDVADDSKAYSVTLINSLRSDISTLQSQIALLQAEVAKGWGIMSDNGLVPYEPEE